MSDHIERRVIAPNVDPMRTHLNRELVRMPEGIRERDDAIAARISSAGIRRKITHDQVRAIRVMLSGTHEDMMEIEKAGKLDDWCRDSMDWLYRTFGRENVVSAVLHMDEHTPHIHATLVPIVTGERRKAGQKKPKEGGRTYRKKANTARLCADDVLNRTRLLAYHDDYAKVMVKYDLQRGVRGSEARHVSTAQYYRDLRRQTGELEANVRQLQAEQEEAEKRLETARKEINTQKLEAVKVEAKTAIIAKVGSLLGSGKIKELEADNRSLQNEIAAREESIEDLQASLQRQRAQYGRELATVQTDYIQKTGKGKGADGISAKMDGSCVRMVPAFRRRDAHGGVLPFGRLHARADGPAFHLPAVGIQRKPLLRRAQEKPLRDGRHRTDGDRAGRERETLCPAHQRKEHPRLVQGAVREAAPTDTANDTATATEKQGIQTVMTINTYVPT